MCAAPLLAVKGGERVLDLCSAPGGKGTQLACQMQGKGIIVLNEPVFSRAKILSQNVERMGIKNAVVISELPENLSVKFAGYFDKILVDAPCSGEGMFRKNAVIGMERRKRCDVRRKAGVYFRGSDENVARWRTDCVLDLHVFHGRGRRAGASVFAKTCRNAALEAGKALSA